MAPRSSRGQALTGHIQSHENKVVTPAKAGVQVFRGQWIPAFAGMTIRGRYTGFFHKTDNSFQNQ